MVQLDMFLNFKNLSELYLSDNSFSVITETSSNSIIPQLKSLGLASCKRRKSPEFLQNESKLSFPSVANNFVDGLVPKCIYNTSVDSSKFLFLSYNSLTGFDRSPVILPQYKLQVLHITHNKFNGSLPILLPSINLVDTSNNALRGEISTFICNLSSLYILDLSANYLVGKLPPCSRKLQ